MIKRNIRDKLIYLATKFPVITVTGPRQSGKTTLVKDSFPDKKYVSLEDLDNRTFATEDPRGFLKTYPNAIIDEAQKVPELFSYIQTAVDRDKIPGQYILTGSQNFLLFEKITQSLAGRVAILKLLPFTYDEISSSSLKKESYEYFLYNGFYPRIYDMEIEATDFYPNYIQTYIERDVRTMSNIGDLGKFQLFLKLCAGRVGQLLNISSLANETGISHTIATKWLSILEASYIIFLLKPHHKNFNKRLVKMPKLYFYDTGIVSFLLGIKSVEQLESHYIKGSLFESFIISEIIKNRFNKGEDENIFFWRDRVGNEIDIIIEKGVSIIPIEVKSGRTINSNYFKGINYLNKLSDVKLDGIIIYGGEKSQFRNDINIQTWKNINKLDL